MANNADMDDDDIYPENDDYVPQESRMQDDEEEEGEEVESDSDVRTSAWIENDLAHKAQDDINFITDVKDEPKQDSSSQNLRPASKTSGDRRPSPTPASSSRRERDGTPQGNASQLSNSQYDGKPATDYPARHTSTLDPLNGNPVHPVTGKPILDTNLDTDFPSEISQAWRKPGADITDYFNYGFDEFTWASWCLKKQSIPKEIDSINANTQQMTQQMKMFFNDPNPMSQMPGVMAGPGAGGMASMPGMPGMPGMPQQMMEWMKANGMNPQTMSPEQAAAAMMNGGVGMQQTPQPPSGPAGFNGPHHDNFGGQGGGGGNRGRGRRGRGNW